METDWLFKQYARKDIERFLAYVLLMYGRENVRWQDMMKVKSEMFGRDNMDFGALLSDLVDAEYLVMELEREEENLETLGTCTVSDKALEEMKNEHS